MFTRVDATRNLARASSRLFSTSTHSSVAVIGAGAGGHSLTSQLLRTGVFTARDISVFDPKQEHHYQPGYTMIAGGVLGNAEQALKKQNYYITRPQSEMFRGSPGVNWVQKAVSEFDPENNALILNDGHRHTYDFLVIAPGSQLNFDTIEGAYEALDDPESPVGSMYRLDYAYKASQLRENFRGGEAVFTLPTMPIKCGGAPQKMLYLSEETFRKNKVRDQSNVHFYTSVGNLFPNCTEYADALAPIAKSKDIDVHFMHLLTKIDKDNRIATFKNTKTDELIHKEYDMLHVVPPHSAPDFVAKSSLAAPNGWLDVNPKSLQHNKYENIFGLGDVNNLPTAKTAAGAFAQTHIVLHNMIRQHQGMTGSQEAEYDGYNSCPLFVGDNKLMLIEFEYGNKSKTTFYNDQTKPRRSFYQMKKHLFPHVYWNYVPYGRWHGRHGFSAPKFV